MFYGASQKIKVVCSSCGQWHTSLFLLHVFTVAAQCWRQWCTSLFLHCSNAAAT